MGEVMEKKHIRIGIIVAILSIIVLYLKDIIDIAHWVLVVLKPLFLGILFALMLKIPMLFCERKLLRKLSHKNFKLARGLSLAFSFLLIVTIFGFFIFVLLPQVGASFVGVLQEVPEFIDSVMVRFGVTSEILSEFFVSIEEDINNILKQILAYTPDVMNFIIKTVGSVSNIFFAMTFAVYILFDMEAMANRYHKIVHAIMPNKYGKYLSSITNKVAVQFDNFFNGQLIEAMILGGICLVGMLILQIPYAVLVSTIIAITAIIPIVGAYIGTIPAVLIIMVESPIMALVFVIFIIVLQNVEGDFIYPHVVGNRVALSPLFVLLAIIVGVAVGGVVGIFIFIPLTSVIYKEVSDYINNKQKAENTENPVVINLEKIEENNDKI